MINEQHFKYWRIYEYNIDLARQAWLTMKGVSDEEKIEGFLKARKLEKLGTLEKGGVDCLLADFLRMEERMAQFGDDRIQFVARVDSKKEPYAFLNNSGRVDFYAWYSGARRRMLGDIPKDGFRAVGQRWKRIREMEEYDEEDRAEADVDLPFWARLDNGFYFTEEAEEVMPEYCPEVERLAELWKKRNED